MQQPAMSVFSPPVSSGGAAPRTASDGGTGGSRAPPLHTHYNQFREVVSINIGQAGIQLANQQWELYCHEHGIGADGLEEKQGCVGEAFNTFFYESDAGQYVPRSVFIDLDPTPVDEIRNGQFKKMFSADHLLSGKEDASSCFARGKYTVGKKLVPDAMDVIQRTVETCKSLQGFFIFHSVGGGTGSGLTDAIVREIRNEYPDKSIFAFPVFPSPSLSTTVVEPYNSLMAMQGLIDNVEVAVPFDNEAGYEICRRRLDIKSPRYIDVNRVFAQVLSATTASIRFRGDLNVDLSEIKNNLVPYDRLHFLLTSLSPVVNTATAPYEKNTTPDATRGAFHPHNLMIKCDAELGKYISLCLMYRGDCSSHEVTQTVRDIRKRNTVVFVDWCPTGCKIGFNSRKPIAMPDWDVPAMERQVVMLSNTSAITQPFARIVRKFDIMYSKRAFVHWYTGDGMEEEEFMEARDSVVAIQREYEDAAKDSAIDDDSDSDFDW